MDLKHRKNASGLKTMPDLSRTFALHGSLVLLVGMTSGLLLHVTIRNRKPEAAWHLAHAGIAGRGIMLIALSGIVPLMRLSAPRMALFSALMLFFAWSSAAAMVFGAAMGVRGQGWNGSLPNRAMYAVYLAGVIAVVPAMVLLLEGLL